MTQSMRRRRAPRIKARAWLGFGIGIAVALIGGGAALAEPKLLIDSHIGNLGAEDPLAGLIVITNEGEPVTIHSLTANDRCTVRFYTNEEQMASTLMTSGMTSFAGLTDVQAPIVVAEGKQNGQHPLIKSDLTLKAGDQVGVMMPALIPGAELMGVPGGGSCGNRLVSLKADTDAGELDWDFSK